MISLKTVIIFLILPSLIFAIGDAEIYYQLVTLNANIQQLTTYVKSLGEYLNQTTIDIKPALLTTLNTFNQKAPIVADNLNKIGTDIVPEIAYYLQNIYVVIFLGTLLFASTCLVMFFCGYSTYLVGRILYNKLINYKLDNNILLSDVSNDL